jgi:MOSC domain-containing protein YiiM
LVGIIRAIHLAPAAGATPVAVREALAVQGRGFAGDRYFLGVGSFSRWPGEGRAVTLVEEEAVDTIRREHGIDLADGRSRRNVVTVGVVLAELVGRRFRIGGALMRGARLAAPCRYLERRVAPGTYDAMKGRGGLRADVLEDGVVRVGDRIDVVVPSRDVLVTRPG